MDKKLFSDTALEELNIIADLIEEIDQKLVLEIDLLGDILSIILPNGKEYVINLHSVKSEIWVSSPFSSASHFSLQNGQWINKKNLEIKSMILNEIKDFLKTIYS